MMDARSLVDLLDDSSSCYPGKTAIEVPGGEHVTYSELASLSDRVRDRLCHLGVLPGDRVALRLRKAAGGIAVIFGILKAGATYVPLDSESPVERVAYILNNCRVRAVITERCLEADLVRQLRQSSCSPIVLSLEDESTANALDKLLDGLQALFPAPAYGSRRRGGGADTAYILYTSGSTGAPKGVMLSHANALSFVDWCSETFAPMPDDRFSSHAPFHFDLSIFDIFVAIKHASTIVLFNEALGKEAMRLAQTISSERITIWYSTPSILGLLGRYGKLERYDYSALRMVLFAGEVFPVPQYLRLRAFWNRPRFFNLYGPTETNVCTFFEIPDDELVSPMSTFPIGRMCKPNLGMVIDEEGNRIRAGGAGELVVSGPNVMQGYWELPEQNARAFFVEGAGTKWYRTGDIVTEDPDRGFIYVGRRDRMVKRRGYRVELGEIEAALLRSEDVQEAAVVATSDVESGVRVTAFVCGTQSHSVNAKVLKSIALRNLPRYMIPDSFVVIAEVPRTSTNKVNYEELKRWATRDC